MGLVLVHGAELLVEELGVFLPGAAHGSPRLQSQLHDQISVHETHALVLRTGDRQGGGHSTSQHS